MGPAKGQSRTCPVAFDYLPDRCVEGNLAGTVEGQPKISVPVPVRTAGVAPFVFSKTGFFSANFLPDLVAAPFHIILI
jgi:hypothetical protein